MTATLSAFLLVAAALFCVGLLAALSRRHAIFILIGIEMMLAAAGLNFIAFWRFGPQPAPPTGVMVTHLRDRDRGGGSGRRPRAGDCGLPALPHDQRRQNRSAKRMSQGIVAYLWLIPALPLAASLLILCLSNKRRGLASGIAIAGQVIAFALSLVAFRPTLAAPGYRAVREFHLVPLRRANAPAGSPARSADGRDAGHDHVR